MARVEARELRQGLVADDESPRSFYRNEIKTMVTVGWPMLVSFFCRFGMASEDLAFVGHINTKIGTPSHHVIGHLAMNLVTYVFLANGVESSDTSSGYGAKEYLAAAGLSDMITSILIIPPLAFNQSLNALVSQAMGAGNKKMAGTWLQLSLVWLTVAHIPVLISFFFVSPMLHLLGFSPDICHLAGMYAKFNAFWPIPNGWYQCMRFYFQAQGITKPAMYNNIAFLGVNALLNWIFVFGGPFRAWFGWHGFGFVGAAVSLSCSRSLQPLFYYLYMWVWRKAHVETWPRLRDRTFMNREHFKNFMKMSLPQMGTMIFQAIVGQATTLLIAKLGTLAISASSAASGATILMSGMSPTLSMVGGIRVGFWLGKGDPVKASRAGWLAVGLGFIVAAVISAACLLLQRQIIEIFTNDVSVQNAAVSILPAVFLNFVASIIVSIGTQGVITSQGRTTTVTWLSFGFELPFSIGSVAILIYVFKAGLVAVFWGQAIVSIVEAVVVLVILKGSNWASFAREAQLRQGKETSDDEEAATEKVGNASEISLNPMCATDGRPTTFVGPKQATGDLQDMEDQTISPDEAAGA